MIKAIYIVSRDPNLSLAECHQHWFEVHGQHHVSSTHKLLHYVQHHTLLPAYEMAPAPTHDGASIVWVEDLPALLAAVATPAWQLAVEDSTTGAYGGRAVFADIMPIAVAEERVVLDGKTNPYMVKAIWAARRNPDLSAEEFRDHYTKVHGPLCQRVPGLRRYVQNLPHEAAKAYDWATHDYWSELWFDDLTAFKTAMASSEWADVVEDAGHAAADGTKPLLDLSSLCFVIGRERPMMVPRF